MKKITVLVITLTIALSLVACEKVEPRIYIKNSVEDDCKEPYVSIMSSSDKLLDTSIYTVSTSEYGVLCTGKCYSSKTSAVLNPLEIQSQGHEVNITLVNTFYEETYNLNSGDTQILCINVARYHEYLYVIVN